MRYTIMKIAVFLSLAFALQATGARAHELSCKLSLAQLDERGVGVIGKPSTVLLVDHYPARVQLNFTVVNDVLDKGSTAQSILLWDFPYPFVPPTPFTVPPGGSMSSPTSGLLTSREQCLSLAHPREIGETSNAVDFTGHVFYDSGQSLCTARLLCGGESTVDAGTPCSGNNLNCLPQ